MQIKINGQRVDIVETILGRVPIMLRSTLCHLSKMNRKELLKAGEEGTEKGGYFICKGSEKVRFSPLQISDICFRTPFRSSGY